MKLLINCILSTLMCTVTIFSQDLTKVIDVSVRDEMEVDGDLIIHFNNNLQESTIDSNSIAIFRIDSTKVTSSYTYLTSADNRSSIIIKPVSSLSFNTFYSVYISNKIIDINGNSIDGNCNGILELSSDDTSFTILTEFDPKFDEKIQESITEYMGKVEKRYDISMNQYDLWGNIPDFTKTLDSLIYERVKILIQDGFLNDIDLRKGIIPNFNFLSIVEVENINYRLGKVQFHKIDGELSNAFPIVLKENGELCSDPEIVFKCMLTLSKNSLDQGPATILLKNLKELRKGIKTLVFLQNVHNICLNIRNAAIDGIISINPQKVVSDFANSLISAYTTDLPNLILLSFMNITSANLLAETRTGIHFLKDMQKSSLTYADACYYDYLEFALPPKAGIYADFLDTYWEETGNLKSQLAEIFEKSKNAVFQEVLGKLNFKDMANVYSVLNTAIKTEELFSNVELGCSSLGEYKKKILEERDGFYARYDSRFAPVFDCTFALAISELFNNRTKYKSKLYDNLILPYTGVHSDTFAVQVNYKSVANIPPGDGVVVLHIDGKVESMNCTTNDWASGVIFTVSLSGLTEGEHEYYFTAYVNGEELRYPDTGTLSFIFTPSSEGYDIAIDINNSSCLPSSIVAGSSIVLNCSIRNKGEHSYINERIKSILIAPDGSQLDATSVNINLLEPSNANTNFELDIDVPTELMNGKYTILTSVNPRLDSDRTNNDWKIEFYIGPSLPREKYQIEKNKLQLHSGDDFLANGFSFTMAVLNTQNCYVGIKTPNNDISKVYQMHLKTWGDYNCAVIVDMIDDTGGEFAYLRTGEAITGGPSYLSNSITCIKGGRAVFSAKTPNGLTFHNTNKVSWFTPFVAGNKENVVQDWIHSVRLNKNNTQAEIIFDVPSSVSAKTYDFYLLAELSGASYDYLTKLKINVLEPPPLILTVDRENISADDTLIINGSNFLNSGRIVFGNVEVLQTIYWNNEEISCIAPSGIEDGLFVVTNSNGSSNPILYHVNSSTGNPEVINSIPDLTISPGVNILIADLNDIFIDPNNDILSFAVEENSKYIDINADSLAIHKLVLIGYGNKVVKCKVIAIATDHDNSSVSDTFTVTIKPPILTQSVILKPNKMNLISFYTAPEDSTAVAVFGSIPDLLIVKDDEGHIFMPADVTVGGNSVIDEVGVVKISKAYSVYTNSIENKIMQIPGLPIILNETSIATQRNKLNKIGFPSRSSKPVSEVINSEKNSKIWENLKVLYDDNGSYFIPPNTLFDGHPGTNTIGSLIPGKGYNIFYKSDKNYNVNYKKTVDDSMNTMFKYVETGEPHLFLIRDHNHILKSGDELAIYGNETCVGAVKIKEKEIQLLNAWRVIPYSDLPGLKNDDRIRIKYYNSQQDKIEELLFSGDTLFKSSQPFSELTITRIFGDTGITSCIEPPVTYELLQNYPNPFNNSTAIRFKIPQKGQVKLIIYNIKGQKVYSLLDKQLEQGHYQVNWNGIDQKGMPLASGIYLYRISSGDFKAIKKLTFIK